MTDLKLIDELLCDIRQRERITWSEMEQWNSVTHEAVQRLREAWRSGEMPVLTLGIAKYFKGTK